MGKKAVRAQEQQLNVICPGAGVGWGWGSDRPLAMLGKRPGRTWKWGPVSEALTDHPEKPWFPALPANENLLDMRKSFLFLLTYFLFKERLMLGPH